MYSDQNKKKNENKPSQPNKGNSFLHNVNADIYTISFENDRNMKKKNQAWNKMHTKIFSKPDIL